MALVTGILLIIGGITDYALTPQIIDKVNTLTSNLESRFIPQIDNSQDNSIQAPSLKMMNSEITDLSAGIKMIEKISEYGSWATMIVGMGMVTYGVFTKRNKTLHVTISYNPDEFKTKKMKPTKENLSDNAQDFVN